tara:strand:- start:3372 stop:3668 length:297 start_codon:yes stop_codon:yes gene_type:complete
LFNLHDTRGRRRGYGRGFRIIQLDSRRRWRRGEFRRHRRFFFGVTIIFLEPRRWRWRWRWRESRRAWRRVVRHVTAPLVVFDVTWSGITIACIELNRI